MVRNMLQLVEGARIEHAKSEQPPDPFVEPRSLEYRPVTQLMLTGVQKIEQYALYDEQGNSPITGAQMPKKRAGEEDGAHMRQRLTPTAKVGCPAQVLEPGRTDDLAPYEDLLHVFSTADDRC